ncbi:thioesterase family protein [Alkalitalea saponilacus]|uniref:Predicted thioesterase n=1 Tax=Alkalitalea saponilacus TaxID=889453 RepID=A0A1T5D267_9BACT|nr:hypothetical protein [Alkalitalea saponilacus]ASB50553.1 hypothetical protein CDL62_16080 [Alkalitalea saponilacus]SKB65805.1 Predicted thioesterase [Alkalitalea saponilacus]
MSTNKIEEGLRLTLEKRVDEEDLANRLGTSGVKAFSTSALILFIEKAVTNLIKPYLDENKETVSSEINVKHFKPVGKGELVRCMVHLKFIENNKLFFDVVVLDESLEEIAIGAHSRYVVDIELFHASIVKQ